MDMHSPSRLSAHYATQDLRDRIDAGLAAVVGVGTRPTVDDLAPVDEFHLRGAEATAELVAMLDVAADARVLDVGSGLGGPARRLAHVRGCRVHGIDLSEHYCAIGNELSRRVGLDEQVELATGDARDLSRFDAGTFDAAWTIHTGMNIPDKPGHYAEVFRVLRPGAPFVVYDILATGDARPDHPTPWAGDPADSHLATRDETVAALESAGFAVREVAERSEGAAEFLGTRLERLRQPGEPPPLGLHVIFGARSLEVFGNLHRALTDGRVVPVLLRAEKP